MSHYKMIDISYKKYSYRSACVSGVIFVGKNVFNLIKEKKIEKGDPIVLAEIAGINAVKNTANFILLSHPINIENVFFKVVLDDITYSIKIYSFVFSNAKTGVEMEAFVGLSAALLTIYDLTKKFNPFSFIKDIGLIFKDGGESGKQLGSLDYLPDEFKKFFIFKENFFDKTSVCVITISDRASLGRYEDLSGKYLVEFFKSKFCSNLVNVIVPDDSLILLNVLKNYMDMYNPNIILTSGGTGISSRDITYDVVNNLCHKIIPGIGEFLRLTGSFYSSNSWLSRSIAGVYKNTLIVSLPGNPNAVSESLNELSPLLLHVADIINKL